MLMTFQIVFFFFIYVHSPFHTTHNDTFSPPLCIASHLLHAYYMYGVCRLETLWYCMYTSHTWHQKQIWSSQDVYCGILDRKDFL